MKTQKNKQNITLNFWIHNSYILTLVLSLLALTFLANSCNKGGNETAATSNNRNLLKNELTDTTISNAIQDSNGHIIPETFVRNSNSSVQNAYENTRASDNAAVPDYIKSFYIDGKINIVEISSFDCPHCRKLHPKRSALLAEYGDAINFTLLIIPLTAQLESSVAYYCAKKQNKEIEFSNYLFENPTKDPDQILQYARKCGINEDSFKSCVTDPASTSAITDMIGNLKKSGLKGVPTVWIDNEQIVGFDESKGITPYRDAIMKTPIANQ